MGNGTETTYDYDEKRLHLNTMTATKDDVIKAAKEIYKDSPEILNAIGL